MITLMLIILGILSFVTLVLFYVLLRAAIIVTKQARELKKERAALKKMTKYMQSTIEEIEQLKGAAERQMKIIYQHDVPAFFDIMKDL